MRKDYLHSASRFRKASASTSQFGCGWVPHGVNWDLPAPEQGCVGARIRVVALAAVLDLAAARRGRAKCSDDVKMSNPGSVSPVGQEP